MQNQFDTWYNNLHARDGNVLAGGAGARSSAYNPSRQESSGRGGEYSDASSRADSKQSWGSSEPSPASFKVSPRGREESRRKQERSDLNDSDGEEDVNEDIMAFYKAKEELLKRRG